MQKDNRQTRRLLDLFLFSLLGRIMQDESTIQPPG
jgi:hypothetical protein